MKKDIPFKFYKDLLAAILNLAVKDLKGFTKETKNYLNKKSAEKFFKSEWFIFILDSLNLNYEAVSKNLKKYFKD